MFCNCRQEVKLYLNYWISKVFLFFFHYRVLLTLKGSSQRKKKRFDPFFYTLHTIFRASRRGNVENKCYQERKRSSKLTRIGQKNGSCVINNLINIFQPIF